MSIGQVPLLLSVGNTIKEVWNNMEGGDRDKIDAVIRKLAGSFMSDPEFANAKQFLVEGSDPLPMRLLGVFADRGVRARIRRTAQAMSNPKARTQTCCVKCRQCGSIQDIELPLGS